MKWKARRMKPAGFFLIFESITLTRGINNKLRNDNFWSRGCPEAALAHILIDLNPHFL